MLRRTQRIVLDDEPDTVEPDDLEFETIRPGAARPQGGGRDAVGAMRAEIEKAFSPLEGSPLRRQPAANESTAKPEAGPGFIPKEPGRRSDRRGMDALRDEALRNVISKVEDKNFGGLRSRVQWGRRMKPSRIALLLVAVTAGGLAAFLSMQREQPATAPVVLASTQPAAPEEVVREARTQILVARQAIGVGQRLTAASVEWVDWPQEAVRPEYITMAAAPDAITGMAGAVARLEFVAGEPINAQKLAQAGEGVLAAVLGSGMRGVSVSVAAESASGGFIVPDDRVDVVVTRSTDLDQVSETILFNVRVLAINAQLGAPKASEEGAQPEVFTDQAIATLELDASQAEMLISASTAGKLSLVLRSILDTAQAEGIEQSPANQAIRISSPFWAK